jgi:hypothetical protein
MRRLGIRSFVPIVLLVTFVAWLARPNRLSAQADDQGGGRAPRAIFGAPILLEGSNCVLVPFGADSSFVPGKLSIGPAYFLNDAIGHVGSPTALAPPLSFGSCFDAGDVHWNNAIMYHTDNHDSVLLLNRKAIIKRFFVPRTEPDHVPRYLVFGIADPNDDGVVKDNGPVTLYISDAEGRGLEAVTPPDTRVEGVTFDSGGATLYVQVATDPSGNHEFSANSPSKMLRIEPLHPVQGAPLWSDGLLDDAMHLVAP